jgi:hypothetical protein
LLVVLVELMEALVAAMLVLMAVEVQVVLVVLAPSRADDVLADEGAANAADEDDAEDDVVVVAVAVWAEAMSAEVTLCEDNGAMVTEMEGSMTVAAVEVIHVVVVSDNGTWHEDFADE